MPTFAFAGWPEEESRVSQWQFWIDRGGTFTDVVARDPHGAYHTHKLLSEAPERYADAALQGIRDLMGLAPGAPIDPALVHSVKMGTTVATNALLERKGERVLLLVTEGFADALRIGNQTRPHLFKLDIQLPELLYERVEEVPGRFRADGMELVPLDLERARGALESAHADGIRAVAIALMHGYRYHDHERAVAAAAREVGFTQISVSHEVSPLMKLVGRGDTTVVDAYLSPILRRYVDRVAANLRNARLMFMQSNGGLVDARRFQGKDSILSGPAGGVVGAVRTGASLGLDRIIGFDMGGTSTDVSHYAGEYERAFETEVAGVRMRAPMMRINTVAAGGGSILHFDGRRYRVGPASAGADPGPACYRRGGPLTVTDCNVMLGKLDPEFFPRVFGEDGDQPLDVDRVRDAFGDLAREIHGATGDTRTPEQVAEGFLRIAVENMANAIKKISIQRGYDITRYTLNCFGAAGGQHACLVADSLAITRVLVHPYAGVLSAYGMGLADLRVIRETAVEAPLRANDLPDLAARLDELEAAGRREMHEQGVAPSLVMAERRVHLRYEGTDTALEVLFGDHAEIVAAFEHIHRGRFGFVSKDKGHIVEALTVEVIGATDTAEDPVIPARGESGGSRALATRDVYFDGEARPTRFFDRAEMMPGARIDGPAVIVESTSTTVVEPGWAAAMNDCGHLVLERVLARESGRAVGTEVDPVMLEIFNSLFMSIAEQMGATLQNTASSVNIKERLDFSCAVFDGEGNLVANAPHIPVHLGSMSESVKSIVASRTGRMRPGDVYMLNAPYNGGTHLPDVTVITPVFGAAGFAGEDRILFYVASRGHHADIGGITPGSMPPYSRTVEEEGVLIDDFQLVEAGHLRESETYELLASNAYPARNPDMNLGDFKAQIAANQMGVAGLHAMVDEFGLDVVHAYMRHVRNNAEESVRRLLHTLDTGTFEYATDAGDVVKVEVSVDQAARSARIDFTGTADQLDSNYNAPRAVTMAAVLYVFRCLVDADIPLNEGCLAPIDLVVPEGSMLNPRYPAAVVGGNVETSQLVTDVLLGALSVAGASQGSANNFTFGNDRYQYYETIAGGSGGGPTYDGASATHVHMTNTRLTDPEVLEWRFPVLLESFSIRRGSGGAGTHPGGDGVVRRVRFLEAMTASIISSHRKVPPYGMAGGEPGRIGRNAVERTDGTVEEMAGGGQAEMGPGDVFVIETPGGGGYGTPGT
jgi:5-oxoprolinase (ATP-hydrolysing)